MLGVRCTTQAASASLVGRCCFASILNVRPYVMSSIQITTRKSLSTQNRIHQAQPKTTVNKTGLFQEKPSIPAINIQQDVADAYKTRVSFKSAPTPRAHPVVWGHGTGPLNSKDLKQYEEQGFLQVEKLLTKAEVDGLLVDFDLLLANPATRLDPRCVIEMHSQEVRSLFEVHKTSLAVQQLLKSSKLTGIARQLLGSDVYIHQSRVNFKPAFTGKGFYWHSDFETWHAEDGMPVPRALSFSISLTENKVANGPLMLIPGSHQTFVSCVGDTPENHHLQSLREQEIGVPDKENLAMLVNKTGRIETVTGTSGSAAIFDSNCMHGSSDNITPTARCNLFIVFNSVENTLGAPYYAKSRRPDYIAATDFTPV